ncbi:MAG TPA: hypothetical protein ENJ09_11620 [Planctomycetes bacterium]|nr:hypothetical protein [Planctomycetota bacterium]
MSERAPLPEVLAAPERARVLVFSPHADDDVIGCGGTLALHRDQGDPVRVVVVFDGRRGDPEGRFDPRAYIERRRAEARAAGALLGVEDYAFWDYPEGHEPGPGEFEAAVGRIADEVRSFRPDVVLAPWIGEHHIDHHTLCRGVREALARVGFTGLALGFEVWTPLVATRIVDVTRVLDRKRAALAEHRSQLEEIEGLADKALALGLQRAMYLGPGARHGEAFRPL